MPIRIDYSPVGTLMNLARSAGEAQGAREGAAHDLAFTQMAMQAQTQNAQIGAAIRRNDQAFQLQRAALARQTRTPTRAAAGPSPVTQEFDRVLGRATVAREWEQEDVTTQMEQVERMRVSGQYSEREIESLKLGVMGGQSLTTLLKEKQITPEKPLVSPTQRITQWRSDWGKKLDPIRSQIARIEKERGRDWDIYDEDGEIDPIKYKIAEDTHKALHRQQADLQLRLNKFEAQQRREWESALQDPRADEVRSPDVRDTPQPLPSDQSRWTIGQIYVGTGGRIGRWTGKDFKKVE